MKRLTHIGTNGEARMVDVSTKPVQLREAVARGEVRLQKETLKLIESQSIAKGNVLATARVAGIQAAKKCGELIPLCHPLPITHCEVNFDVPKGLDRIVMILAGAESLREVIPFPKTARAVDLMVDAPTPVGERQLHELGIVVKK